jgi:ankyrin repeat protein
MDGSRTSAQQVLLCANCSRLAAVSLPACHPARQRTSGLTALQLAAKADQAAAVTALLDAAANPDAANALGGGRTAMHYAAEAGAADAAGALLARGAQACTAAADGREPLHFAAERGCVGVLRALLGAGAGLVSADGRHNALRIAAGRGDVAAVEVLTAPRLPLSQADQAALLAFALDSSDAPLLRQLVADQGVRPSSVPGGADGSSDGGRALCWAAQAGDADLARLLLGAGGVHPDAPGTGARRPLLAAIEAAGAGPAPDVARVFAALLDAGAAASACDPGGRSALHHAAAADAAWALRELVQRGGADPGQPTANDEGVPPLHLAARHGHLSAVATLLQLGASPDTPDSRGRRALHHATSGNGLPARERERERDYAGAVRRGVG